MFGGLVWLKQPDSQAEHRTSAKYQRDACVASFAVYMQPGAPVEQGAPAGDNTQAGKDQRQPELVAEFERFALQLDCPLERAAS